MKEKLNQTSSASGRFHGKSKIKTEHYENVFILKFKQKNKIARRKQVTGTERERARKRERGIP